MIGKAVQHKTVLGNQDNGCGGTDFRCAVCGGPINSKAHCLNVECWAEFAKKNLTALRVENTRLRAVANAAAKVRAERIAFLSVAKAMCPARSPALEQAEAEMDAALDADSNIEPELAKLRAAADAERNKTATLEAALRQALREMEDVRDMSRLTPLSQEDLARGIRIAIDALDVLEKS